MLSVTSTSRNQLEDVLALMKQGALKAVISQSLPLEDAGRAHALVEAGRSTGRIVLRPNA
jgi:NADPH:quinone reductase-like Zn-dependent oxidoreductase